jgi:hypothetical protein
MRPIPVKSRCRNDRTAVPFRWAWYKTELACVGPPPTKQCFKTLIVFNVAPQWVLDDLADRTPRSFREIMTRIRFCVLLLSVSACMPALGQLQYVPLQTPCRAVDTRLTGGALADDSIQIFDPGQACGIPSQGNNPIVFAMNVTVVPHGGLGALTVYPTGVPTPLVSTLNSYDGRVKSNYALVAGGVGTGDVSVWASNATDVILDVSGYFVQAPATGPSMLYTPVTPCRLIDTRNSTGPLGGPYLSAGKPRSFSLAGQCGLPDLSNGGVLSVNVTAVPRSGTLGYLTVWGTSETENTTPISSTLNAPTGTVVANAAFLTINPGTDTSISAYAYNDTDLIVDVTGFFSEGTTGMAYYPAPVPLRLLDTRIDPNPDSPPIEPAPFTGEKTLDFTRSQTVYVLNATVVPAAPLWVLTLWPDGIAEPLVSTLNSYDATVTSNMAIVGTGADAAFDVNAEGGPTQLILDLSGFFQVRTVVTASTVEFVGDEISAGLVAAANNPNWQCFNCQSGTTSSLALAQLPIVIASKPEAVHILVGAHELSGPGPSPSDPAVEGTVPLANIASMVRLLQAAKIPAVLGDIPPCLDIPFYRFDVYMLNGYGPGFEGPPWDSVPDVTFASYDSIGGGMGVIPNPDCPASEPTSQGYADMLVLAQSAITQATTKVQHGDGR